MARDLSAQLDALIASGHCRSIPVLDITLGDGTLLFYGTQPVVANGHSYLAKLNPPDAFSMSLDLEGDRVQVEIENIERTLGQTIANSSVVMDRAAAMLGMVFVDSVGNKYYDAKMPGELTGAQVDREKVPFSLISTLDAAGDINAVSVGDAFPFAEPLPVSLRTDPNDNLPRLPGGGTGGGGPRVDPFDPTGGGINRHLPLERPDIGN